MHQVFYLGLEQRLEDIPKHLRCIKITRHVDESILDCAINFVKKSRMHFDRVISLSEYELMDAALLRQYFQIIGQQVEDVVKVRDKVLMKQLVKQAGVLVPEFTELIDVVAGKSQIVSKFAGKIVLKPKDGAASSGVLEFENIQSFFELFEEKDKQLAHLSPETFHNYEIESFIAGDIYHIDGIVSKGEIFVWQANKYINTCLDYANGKPLGSIQIVPKACYEEIICKVIDALHIVDSSFHLELIETNKGEIYFLEIANRPGGGDIGKIFSLKTSIHLQSASVLSMLGVDIPKPKWEEEYFGFFLVPITHKVPQYLLDDSRLLEYKINKNVTNKEVSYRSDDVPFSGIIKGSPCAMEEYLNLLFGTVNSFGG